MSSSGTIPSRAAERGFVLATTLLVTTLLTVMLAASFLLVSAEQRTTDNSFGTARALALAQAHSSLTLLCRAPTHWLAPKQHCHPLNMTLQLRSR